MVSALPPLVQAASGALGGAISNAIIYPLDTIVTRMQTTGKAKAGKANPYGSIPQAVRTMLREEGWLSFYRGIVSDSLSTFLSNFLYFAVYSLLRNTLIARRLKLDPPPVASAAKGKPVAIPVLSALEEIVIGMLSGVAAKAVVSPLSNITVRQQTATSATERIVGLKEGEKTAVGGDASSDDDEDEGGYADPSAFSIAREILSEKGWTGFWSGFKSSVILTTNPALTSYLLEAFKRAVIPFKHLEHPTPAQVFLTSAFASSIAAAITYPMILAKSRLMFKSPSGRRLYKSNYDVFVKTIKRHGVTGLYAGLSGQLVKGFVSEGLKMTIKDRLELMIVLAHRILTTRTRLAQA